MTAEMSRPVRTISISVSVAASASLCVGVALAQTSPSAPAIDPAQPASQPTTEPAPEESAGLLSIPDFAGDFWSRHYLTGDWGGARTSLANHGVQLDIQWVQTVQSVVQGGSNDKTSYGGTLDYNLNLDLMRMGLLPGALI